MTINLIKILIIDEDKDSDDEFDPKYNARKRLRAINIYKIKDYLMMIFLLLSSSVNFSILYIPFIILGISYVFLLLKYNNHMNSMKRKIEIISLIYAFLLLIFKSIILGMIQNDNIDYDNYSNLFNNFGIKFQKDEQRKLEIFFCIIGEIILIIISVISIIISNIYKIINFDEKNNNQFSRESFDKKVKTIIYLGYISILVNAIYNKSFLTIAYLLSYQFILILLVLKIKTYNLFKNATIVYLIFFTVHLFLINIFNIYSIQEKLLKENIIKDEDGDQIIKVYSIYTMIGINYSFYNSFLDFMYEWLSYIACVFVIVLFTINQRIFNEIDINAKTDNFHEKNIDERDEKKGLCYRFKNAMLNLFTNPEFVLFFFRLLSLLWIYLLRTFFSFGIFIFIFFSFIFDELNKIHYLVIFIL